MGQAKNRRQFHELNLISISKSTERFRITDSFEKFTFHEDINLHSVKAYQHLMNLIFIRAKHLHRSLVRSIQENDSYSSFVLLKAYWENVAMFGYVFITAKNLMKNNDYNSLLELAIKNALGGRGFVTDEMLQRSCTTREKLTQTNLITWMQKIDADFDKEVAKKKDFSQFEKFYNEFIAECGHSTFLGLNICEEKQPDGSININTNKTSQYNDDKMSFNHLALADNYFFYYWDKYSEEIKKYLDQLILDSSSPIII